MLVVANLIIPKGRASGSYLFLNFHHNMDLIDLSGNEHIIDGNMVLPHTHYGYIHDEHGTKILSKSENALIDMVKSAWYIRNRKK